MNHELRAAAINRAIEIVSATEWSGDLRVNMNRVIGAGRVLAKAYLAEHPADDDEPVTAEWLESIGANSDDGLFFTGHDAVDFELTEFEGTWHVDVGWRTICLVETRGDVRRLLAALGIEVAK